MTEFVGAPLADERLARAAQTFADLLKEGALKEDVPVLLTNPTEAEAVKLLLIFIWPCVCPSLTSWTPIPRCAD